MAMNSRLLRPIASGFNPTRLSGLVLWLDASFSPSLFQNSDGTLPATAASDPVGYWGDRSGNGNHATQATANNRPTISTTSLNGKKTLTFDGSNDRLSSITSSLQPSTIFAVVNCTTSGAFPLGRTIIGSSATNNALAWIEDAKWEFVRWGQNMTGPTATNATTNILSATNDGTTSTLYVNGSNAVTDVGGTFASGPLTIGAATSQQFFTGFMAEIVIYNRVLSQPDKARTEQYLAAKWGLSLA